MKTVISTAEDWGELKVSGLGTVVDPMVIRCGELFLRGARGVDDPEKVWELLSANVHALGMFFDTVILNDRVPVFDYADTFDGKLNIGKGLFERLNENGEMLHEVRVDYREYHRVKDAALEAVTELYEGPRPILRTARDEILTELAAAEYNWTPSLGELEHRLEADDRKVAAFFLGGLIFGGYAQQTGCSHVIQPKRSRIMLAAHLGAASADYGLEAQLFDKLKEVANVRYEEIPWVPTFLPYLLSRAKTPADILKEVIRLRQDNGVADYRAWWRRVLEEWDGGQISTATRNDVAAIRKAVDYKTGAASALPDVNASVGLAEAAKGKPPGKINLLPTLKWLWGWTLASLPGNRYRKVLARAIVADKEFVELPKAVKKVWES